MFLVCFLVFFSLACHDCIWHRSWGHGWDGSTDTGANTKAIRPLTSQNGYTRVSRARFPTRVPWGFNEATFVFSFVFHWIWIPSLLVKLPTSSFDDLLLRCCRARFAINLATLAGDFPLKGSWKHVAGMPLLPSGPTQGSPSCKFGHPGQRQQYFCLRFFILHFHLCPLRLCPSMSHQLKHLEKRSLGSTLKCTKYCSSLVERRTWWFKSRSFEPWSNAMKRDLS